MSALGQKQTYAVQQAMSALPPIATAKADICDAGCLISLPSRFSATVISRHHDRDHIDGLKDTGRNARLGAAMARRVTGLHKLGRQRRVLRHLDPQFTVPRQGDNFAAMVADEIVQRLPQSHALRGNLLRPFNAIRVVKPSRGHQ